MIRSTAVARRNLLLCEVLISDHFRIRGRWTSCRNSMFRHEEKREICGHASNVRPRRCMPKHGCIKRRCTSIDWRRLETGSLQIAGQECSMRTPQTKNCKVRRYTTARSADRLLQSPLIYYCKVRWFPVDKNNSGCSWTGYSERNDVEDIACWKHPCRVKPLADAYYHRA